MTLNKRLATAAAAMVQRIINRSRPRVFRPVSPLRKGSIENVSAILFLIRGEESKGSQRLIRLAHSAHNVKSQISPMRLKIKVFVFTTSGKICCAEILFILDF